MAAPWNSCRDEQPCGLPKLCRDQRQKASEGRDLHTGAVATVQLMEPLKLVVDSHKLVTDVATIVDFLEG